MTLPVLLAAALTVAPTGNSKFDAVFDAPLGEKIDAMSSSVSCALTYDPATGAQGTCQVPLTSINVDNEPTKTEHFQQWATNKKSNPKSCRIEAKLSDVKATPAVLSESESQLAGEAAFTVCGRARSDGGKEKVSGTAMLLPTGQVRIRVRVEHFNRDLYRIGPKYTEGWLSRVQQLAPIVAEDGTIDVSLLARTAQPNPSETKAAARP
jgi:hypothetical protein